MIILYYFSVFILLFCLGINAGDITENYLKNPSFELDNLDSLELDVKRTAYKVSEITDWKVSQEWLDGNYAISEIMTSKTIETDNNFGAPGEPSDGDKMYYMRNAWTEASVSLLQKVKLPSGSYKITVDNKCVSGKNHKAYLVVDENQTELEFGGSFNEMEWKTSELYFKLTEEKEVEVGIKIDFLNESGGSILVDNFRLYDVPEDMVDSNAGNQGSKEPDNPSEGSKLQPNKDTTNNNDNTSGIENIKIFSTLSALFIVITCWMYIL